MEWKDRKRHPKESEGNLGLKKHVLGGVRVDDGECDDHMCDGHSSFFVVCSCGWASPDVGGRSTEEEVINGHRMAVIEHHLGLTILENDDV
jgi:hypothetical protein